MYVIRFCMKNKLLLNHAPKWLKPKKALSFKIIGNGAPVGKIGTMSHHRARSDWLIILKGVSPEREKFKNKSH